MVRLGKAYLRCRVTIPRPRGAEIRRQGTKFSLAGDLVEPPAALAHPSALRSGSPGEPAATPSRLLVLFLALLLTVVGAIHVAEDGSFTSTGGTGYPVVQAPGHLEQGAGGNEDQSCSAGAQAQRNVGELKNDLDKSCSPAILPKVSSLRPDSRGTIHKPASVEPVPNYGTLPQELLRRPPPAK